MFLGAFSPVPYKYNILGAILNLLHLPPKSHSNPLPTTGAPCRPRTAQHYCRTIVTSQPTIPAPGYQERITRRKLFSIYTELPYGACAKQPWFGNMIPHTAYPTRTRQYDARLPTTTPANQII
ncbi:hypothetical protein B9Z19DRAFT_1070512 [Tuber borchii]|uniref:Uncharacterized protein n=1 Tax=Tuber borchii TaxID=42251 RepID=A0A2T7A928_TUBBO|nr:hypothetical protein B9Z19DRAFT_1070512 [Tuber borchii]